jgi:hypothetical protein
MTEKKSTLSKSPSELLLWIVHEESWGTGVSGAYRTHIYNGIKAHKLGEESVSLAKPFHSNGASLF